LGLQEPFGALQTLRSVSECFDAAGRLRERAMQIIEQLRDAQLRKLGACLGTPQLAAQVPIFGLEAAYPRMGVGRHVMKRK
jgi:hypothetical protein